MNVKWDKIYAGRGLYSGHGSRGRCATLKANAIETILRELCPKTMLDVGCGDFHIMSTVNVGETEYTGIDGSEVLVRELRHRLPDHTLICEDFLEWSPPCRYDLVICLDVLIHFEARADYRRFADKLLKVCCGGLLVSGFTKSSPTVERSPVIFFHESLLHTFDGMQIRVMDEYHESSLAYVDTTRQHETRILEGLK